MGYGEIELNKYRNELNNHMDQLQNRNIKLWAKDNNGQICRTDSTNYIIEKWAIGSKTEVGNGGNVSTYAKAKTLLVWTCLHPQK